MAGTRRATATGSARSRAPAPSPGRQKRRSKQIGQKRLRQRGKTLRRCWPSMGRQMEIQRPVKATRGKVKVDGYGTEWIARQAYRLKPTTIQTYTYSWRHVVRGIGHMNLTDVELKDLQRWFGSLEMGAATKKHVRVVLNEVFKGAVADKLISYNPVADFKIGEEHRAPEMRIRHCRR